MEVLAFVGAIALLDVAANLLGADSRDGRDWSVHDDESLGWLRRAR